MSQFNLDASVRDRENLVNNQSRISFLNGAKDGGTGAAETPKDQTLARNLMKLN